jgi:hypothetical protein
MLLPFQLRAAALGCLLLASASACSTSSEEQGVDGTGPVYLLSRTVFGTEDERTVYFSLAPDMEDPSAAMAAEREFPGVANAGGIGGRLLVSDGEQPLIHRFSVTDALRWVDAGTLSFAGYPLADNANLFGQYQVNEQTMYLPFEGYKRILWDPTAFEITTVLEDSALLPELDGLTLEPAGNRTGIRYDGPVLHPFFYHDEDWYDFGSISPIAVYDPESHRETAVIDGPCPGLAVPSRDEAGNTYFSSWDYTPLFALYGEGPAPCVARVTPERTLDEAFTSDLTEWTGGRYVQNFRYIRDGWGLADVLLHENLDADFSGELDPAVLDQIYDFTNYQLWRIDLAQGRAEPYTDVAASSFGWSAATIDDRSLLFVPLEGGARTKVYELDASGGAAELYEVPGDASWLRVR